jgi:3-oxoacyl-[acyl-carrier protein] reductase
MPKTKTDLPQLTDLISLHRKRALITGAASGIGKATARRFAEAGADLHLVDIDSKGLVAVQKELSTFGTDVTTHIVNLASKKEIDDLWANIKPNLPEILVNNAGFYPFRDFVDVEEAYYRKIMDTNLDSVYWMCQHMIRERMKRKQGGVIVNMGSIEAILPFKDDLGHYSISKAGVIALTRALAREHARHGFRVNAILPGGIMTNGTRNAAKQILQFKFDLIKTGIEFAQRLPVKRAGKPDEVARVALMLASDFASYIHGALIPVDGGFLAA